jgi:hypothetical protein
MKSVARGFRYFSRLTVIITIAVLGFSLPGYGKSYSLIIDQPVKAPLSAKMVGLSAGFPSALQSRAIALNPVIASPDVLVPGDMITINLFADTVLTAKVDVVSENVNGTVIVRGCLENYPLGYLIITTTNNNTLASIRIPETGKCYRIQMDALTGTHYLLEENTDQIDELKEGPALIPPVTPQKKAGIKTLADTLSDDPLESVTLDVMIVYTPAARQWADEQGGGIANVIAQSVESGQLVLDNSDTFMTLNLVHLSEVNYTESGSSYTDLNRLTNPSDGYMDSVHTLRDQYGADVVTLLTVTSDVSGLGWILNSTSGQPGYAFSIVHVIWAASPYSSGYTYIHEFGHNMGCGHRKDQPIQPGPGIFSYSAGWHWIGNDGHKYCSVMSYQDAGDAFVPYFSNPSILFAGVPTGDAADGDNARTIRETKSIVAAYRPTALTGSLSVTISPQGAIDAGARWRRMGTSTWRNSGFTQSGLAVGQHSVEFSSIYGWKTPASQIVEVNDGQTTYAIGTYTLYPPAFTPDGGSYSNKQNVTITCATPGVTIHYTTNGDDPTESDPVIAPGSSVLVGHTMRLKAKAWKTGVEPSEIKTADYQVTLLRPESDLNNDCIVNFKDFALLGNWWRYDCGMSNGWCEAADFDSSGDVGIKDLAVLASQWLTEGEYVLHVNSSFEATGASISSSTGHGGTTNYTQILTTGTSVTLTAPAVVNDRPFTGWTGDVSSINQTISFSMDADKTVTANYGLAAMILVDINDPGFKGQMSKYETTNAQYCQFLNDANAAGLITVADDIVYATSDTEHLYPYFRIYPGYNTSQITWSGGTFSVRSRDGYSMDNYPVTDVSWYGSTAFCDYYGYRLPTEMEWQAVADFDGSYTYGCGTTIDQSKANYGGINPLNLSYYPYTTPVGYYPAYGYGICDMAGNAWEWTSNGYLRGGHWNGGESGCSVSSRDYYPPDVAVCNFGFRVCH